MTPTKITAEQVKAEVQRFWNAFVDKNANQLMEFYAPESSVFSSVSARMEPGRLAAARRQREYFDKGSKLRATVGMMDVVVLSDVSAVASYTFQFHADKVTSISRQSTSEDITNGRATHVFQLDGDDNLRIVHEHLSSLDKH